MNDTSIHMVQVDCGTMHHALYKSYWGVTTIALICMQATLSAPLGSPPTGYLLEYHVYDNTSTIELPALNTSYTLDSVPSGALYNITVSALSDVGPSKNNPSVQFGELSIQIYCIKMFVSVSLEENFSLEM